MSQFLSTAAAISYRKKHFNYKTNEGKASRSTSPNTLRCLIDPEKMDKYLTVSRINILM